MTVLVKNTIRQGVRLAEDPEGFIWLRLEKSFFKLQNDVFLCEAYVLLAIQPRISIQKQTILGI